jgi:single-stranded-DNA-specific exonuclease
MQTDCGFHGTKLCTAGIVWLLGIVLLKSLQSLKEIKLAISSKELLDLAAIGTICDMVPLQGVNRLLASKGIESIRLNPRMGIKAIQEVAQLPLGSRFSCSSVAFGIGPRLNAAGRLEDASIGMSLLISDSSNEAKSLAEKINSFNNQRKTLEEKVKSTCLDLAADLKNILGENPSAYTLFNNDFHVGVIGIAAQRMVESLSRPVAVLGKTEDSNKSNLIKGSVRSINGFHISETLNKLNHLLISHGGHKEAGGFSILEENILKFTIEFNKIAEDFFSKNPIIPEISFDQQISLKDININLVKEIELLAPFGIGNSSPIFLSREVEIFNFHQIGANHVKIELKQDGTIRNAIGWRMIGNPLIERGKKVDAIYSLELNTYKGVSSVQLILKELM